MQVKDQTFYHQTQSASSPLLPLSPPRPNNLKGFVAMAEEPQFSLGTEFEDEPTDFDVKPPKPDNGVRPNAFDSIDKKPRYSAPAQNLKRKSPLDHDHGEAKKSCHSSQFLCGICFVHKPVSDMLHGKCNHPFCTHCISKHVATQIQQNVVNVICPDPDCSVELEPEYFHTILPSEVIVRWETVRCESLIVGLEKTYCPFKDCSVLMVNDGEEVVTSAECPSCHRLFCAQCKVPWHESMSCEEFKRNYKDEEELDNKFFKLAKGENWQKCPKCTMFVQRPDGCEHMTCRCGCNFCYICGENWEHGHLCKQHPST